MLSWAWPAIRGFIIRAFAPGEVMLTVGAIESGGGGGGGGGGGAKSSDGFKRAMALRGTPLIFANAPHIKIFPPFCRARVQIQLSALALRVGSIVPSELSRANPRTRTL